MSIQGRTNATGDRLPVHAIAHYKLVDLLCRRAGRDLPSDALDGDVDVLAAVDTEAGEARHDLAKLLERGPKDPQLQIATLRKRMDKCSTTDGREIDVVAGSKRRGQTRNETTRCNVSQL